MRRFLSLFVLLLFILPSNDDKLRAQCPGSIVCEGAVPYCSANLLNGLSCNTTSTPNSGFPLATLCFGSGTPTNLSWWAFVGDGDPVSLTISSVTGSCPIGFQVGIFEGTCDGSSVADCNINCLDNSKVLSFGTVSCQIYYLWVDGCDGSVCNFNIAVSGGGTPQLPDPLPPISFRGDDCLGGTGELSLGAFGDCFPTVQWEVDGIPYGRSDAIEVDFLELKTYEICLTATIGNPDNSATICDQDTRCAFFTPVVYSRTGGLQELCPSNDPYLWHGTPIVQSCINPPCSTRVMESGGCIVDSFKSFIINPPEIKIGPLLNIKISQVPYFWHNQVITSSCISPPCTARLEDRNGCLFDSIRQIRILYSPLDSAIVKGKVYSDLNVNCDDDTGEPLLEGIQVSLSNAQRAFQTLTDSNGCYSLLVPFDTFNIEARDLTDSIIACPLDVLLNVNTQDSIYCIDFYKPPSHCYPGRLKWIPLSGRNRLRCDPLNRRITLEAFNYDGDELPSEEIIVQVDSLFTFLSATLPFRIISNNEMAITLPAIPSGESVGVSILFEPDCDRDNETNAVCFTTFYEALYQCNSNLLQDKICETILNSKDPNDLRVTPYGFEDARYIFRENTLTGIIRYHNDGTDTAYDISVDLTIDWERVDLGSIELIRSSAPVITMNTNANGVQFNLPNVKLPHNDVDSINSHGYIMYSVRPKATIPDWYMIAQQAFIYFDFNDAIETNVERQIIAGPYLTEFFEVVACIGDTVQNVRIEKDTTFSDTLFNTRPFTINTYSVQSWPTYLFESDTVVLAGDIFLGTLITEDTTLAQNYTSIKGCDSSYVYHIEAKTTATFDKDSTFEIYPNPFSKGTLFLKNEGQSMSSLELISADGRKICFQLDGQNNATLQPRGLKSGIYFFQVLSDKEVLNAGKLVVTE